MYHDLPYLVTPQGSCWIVNFNGSDNSDDWDLIVANLRTDGKPDFESAVHVDDAEWDESDPMNIWDNGIRPSKEERAFVTETVGNAIRILNAYQN